MKLVIPVKSSLYWISCADHWLSGCIWGYLGEFSMQMCWLIETVLFKILPMVILTGSWGVNYGLAPWSCLVGKAFCNVDEHYTHFFLTESVFIFLLLYLVLNFPVKKKSQSKTDQRYRKWPVLTSFEMRISVPVSRFEFCCPCCMRSSYKCYKLSIVQIPVQS